MTEEPDITILDWAAWHEQRIKDLEARLDAGLPLPYRGVYSDEPLTDHELNIVGRKRLSDGRIVRLATKERLDKHAQYIRRKNRERAKRDAQECGGISDAGSVA